MATNYANGLEITVVDDSDYVGWAAAATRVGEIYMHDIKSMVANVIATCCVGSNKYKRIARLNILDHGNPEGFQLGGDWISMGSFPAAAIELVKLRPYFAKGGMVHLQHCQIGQNKLLIVKLAQLLRVQVYAGTGDQNPIYRVNLLGTGPIPFENYVVASPDGSCKLSMRPENFDSGDLQIPTIVTPYSVTIDL